MFAIGDLGGSWPTLRGLAAEWAAFLEYYAPGNLMPGTSEDSPQPDFYYMQEDDGAYLLGSTLSPTGMAAVAARLQAIKEISDGI